MNLNGGSSTADAGVGQWLNFTDDASQSIANLSFNDPEYNWAPLQPLSAFIGLQSATRWEVSVFDSLDDGDEGSYNGYLYVYSEWEEVSNESPYEEYCYEIENIEYGEIMFSM